MCLVFDTRSCTWSMIPIWKDFHDVNLNSMCLCKHDQMRDSTVRLTYLEAKVIDAKPICHLSTHWCLSISLDLFHCACVCLCVSGGEGVVKIDNRQPPTPSPIPTLPPILLPLTQLNKCSSRLHHNYDTIVSLIWTPSPFPPSYVTPFLLFPPQLCFHPIQNFKPGYLFSKSIWMYIIHCLN